MEDFKMYFTEGWNHIMSSDALDHQLFILSLAALFLWKDWRRVLVLVTAFTIGHSLTLALSVYDVIRFSIAWVEFLIPITILLTALYDLRYLNISKIEGRSIARDIEKTITLALIDDKWKEHLRNMDDLKDAVQTASFEQKDPLVIYKMEAYSLFEDLVRKINHDVTAYLAKGNMAIAMEAEQVREAKIQKTDFSRARIHKDDSDGYDDDPHRTGPPATTVEKPVTYVRSEKKIGRNDPCPCGSGKKFKACHGAHE